MSCRSARLEREYETKYHGVFKSPFDYDVTLSYAQLAELHTSQRIPLSEGEKEALSRLEKFALLDSISKLVHV